MHKPNASTGMSSNASGGKSICATTIITAKIARLKPKSELINPFQNIHQTFHQMYQVFYIFLHPFRGNIKTRKHICVIHTGSYFRKYVIHLGAGVVYLARAWEALWCGILDTLRVKSGEFFIKTHRICGKFATEKDSLAESAEI